MRRSIARISSGSRGIRCGVVLGGWGSLRRGAAVAAVVGMAVAGVMITGAPACGQPPVPFSLRLEVNGSIPPFAVAPGPVVVRRGLFGRPRAVVVPGPVAVPVPPFGFPGIPVPPWVVFNGGEIVVESAPPDVVLPPPAEAAPSPAEAPAPEAADPNAAPPPADPAPAPADAAPPGASAKPPRALSPTPRVARAMPAPAQPPITAQPPIAAKRPITAQPMAPRSGSGTVAAKVPAGAERIAAPLPQPAAAAAPAEQPLPAETTPFTPAWFAARPDAWRPEKMPANTWRPADVAAVTAWIAANAGGVTPAGGGAAQPAADGLRSVLVLPTGREGAAADAAEWLPLGVFAVVPPGGTAEASQQMLFVDRTGAIRGNFHDPLSDTVQPVAGVVDLAAGKASWTVGAAGSRFECPLTEFTAFPGQVAVTAGGRTRTLDIVPIPAP
jgi:hypothetical protein